MKHIVTATAAIVSFGLALAYLHHQRSSKSVATPLKTQTTGYRADVPVSNVRAAGRIEGRTQAIELRARMIEQIRTIHVRHGQMVSAGDVLVSLVSDRLIHEKDLAVARLNEAKAQKTRLLNGYLPSEIETALQEYQAIVAETEGAEKAYERALKLRHQNAVSQQAIDDRYSELNMLRARANAARAKYETINAPPRQDEIMAAEASIAAADAQLRIAKTNLDCASILAPITGRVLSVEAKIGELTGPDSTEPLVVMADTNRLRVMAEVDEYDALRVVIDQQCAITSDAASGIIATGRVSEIEPQMFPKRLFGQWAGERNDTFSRRVWIDLDPCGELPIGLPVDVYIRASPVSDSP